LAWVLKPATVDIVRINIEIDNALMTKTLGATGVKTKREAVELGLRTLLRLRRQAEIRQYRNQLAWESDLEAMRLDKV
jgi:Arc/MetJ family transcription regulator